MDLDPRILRVAAQIVGLGAGVIAFVYVCGGIVLGLRLAIGGLPIQTVLGQLPRDFVVSVGLVQVVLPSLAGACIYAAYRVLRGPAVRPPAWPRWSSANACGRARLGLKALIWTIPLAAPGIALPIHQEAHGRGVRPDLLFLLIPFVLLFLTTLVTRDVLSLIARRPNVQWRNLGTIGVATFVVFIALIPAWISLASAFSPPPARLCTNGGDRAFAYLIGETSDDVILGDFGSAPRPVVVVPRDKVAQLVVGDRFLQIPCFVSNG